MITRQQLSLFFLISSMKSTIKILECYARNTSDDKKLTSVFKSYPLRWFKLALDLLPIKYSAYISSQFYINLLNDKKNEL